jgi:hypothetical protein
MRAWQHIAWTMLLAIKLAAHGISGATSSNAICLFVGRPGA